MLVDLVKHILRTMYVKSPRSIKVIVQSDHVDEMARRLVGSTKDERSVKSIGMTISDFSDRGSRCESLGGRVNKACSTFSGFLLHRRSSRACSR